MNKSVYLLGVLLLSLQFACSEKTEPGGATPQEAEAKAAVAPEPKTGPKTAPKTVPKTVPEPKESRFLGEVAALSYPSRQADDRKITLKWDFSPGKQYKFDFSQTVNAYSDVGELAGNQTQSEQSIVSSGQMLLKSQASHLARMVLQNVTAQMQYKMQDKAVKEFTQRIPPMVIDGMTESGRFDEGGASQELLFKVLFPLPQDAIKVGENVSVPVKMPFNAGGSPLFVEGTIDLTLSAMVDCNGDICAQLDSVLTIDKFDQPEEIQGRYSIRLQGKSRSFFSITQGRFVKVASAVLMILKGQVVTAEIQSPGVDTSKLPAEMTTTMISDNLIQISAIQP